MHPFREVFFEVRPHWLVRGPALQNRNRRRRINTQQRENGFVWHEAEQADNFSFFLSIQKSHLEYFAYRQVLYKALIVDWGEKHRTRSAILVTNKLTLSDTSKLGRREVGGYRQELTGKEIIWEATGSDASSGALDDSKVISTAQVGWHICCLFTWSLLHACEKKFFSLMVKIFVWIYKDFTYVATIAIKVQKVLNFKIHNSICIIFLVFSHATLMFFPF